jgi:hypothetical protein
LHHLDFERGPERAEHKLRDRFAACAVLFRARRRRIERLQAYHFRTKRILRAQRADVARAA